jgi:hypothetical protein
LWNYAEDSVYKRKPRAVDELQATVGEENVVLCYSVFEGPHDYIPQPIVSKATLPLHLKSSINVTGIQYVLKC